MVELATHRRTQPPPPILFDILVDPLQEARRPWLDLRDDEIPPSVVAATKDESVVWSSIWPQHPAVQIRFDLSYADGGSSLRWALLAEDPIDAEVVRCMRSRIDRLINGNLRLAFGQ